MTHGQGGRHNVGMDGDLLSPGQGLVLVGDKAALELEVAVALVVGAALLLELDLEGQGRPQ